uniref:Metalloendopeptidase n=1 Tax=Parastrongyloides trichosuri TaxID=131310 RepID=A0A0N5A6W5_PARTI
ENGINIHWNADTCTIDFVGMKPKSGNTIYVSYDCYKNEVFMISLILQVLGLEDEHNRFDRDKYVLIYSDNIKPDLRKYFIRENTSETETYGIEYDYGSIIHGNPTMYHHNGGKTIQAIGEHGYYYQKMIGQRRAVSFTEYKLINYHYCNSSCNSIYNKTEIKKPTCLHGGYPHPNLAKCGTCLCPFKLYGTQCRQLQAPEHYCPYQEYTATNKTNLVEFRRVASCTTRITAQDKERGARVHLRIMSLYLSDYAYCARGHSYFEVKYKSDKGLMGICFCNEIKDIEDSHDIYTEDGEALLIYVGYYLTQYANAFYDQHWEIDFENDKEEL